MRWHKTTRRLYIKGRYQTWIMVRMKIFNKTMNGEVGMKMKMLLCGLILTVGVAVNANAGNGRDLGDTIVDTAKVLMKTKEAPTIGGNATAKATINGVGGIVNVGVGVGGAVEAKQTVAAILSGNISGNADAEVTINGVGGVVNVGVAVGSANVTCQSVGTVGGSGC